MTSLKFQPGVSWSVQIVVIYVCLSGLWLGGLLYILVCVAIEMRNGNRTGNSHSSMRNRRSVKPETASVPTAKPSTPDSGKDGIWEEVITMTHTHTHTLTHSLPQ